MSARLPRSQSTSKCQLRCTPFSPTAVLQAVCNQLARLQSVSTAAQCQLLCSPACNMSVQLQSGSSAVFCQLDCNVSALAYSVMQFICCDRPAARHQLSYEVQAPLQSVISAANGLLSHDMSPWPQSVSSVCQLSCDVSAQLSSAQLLSEGSVATRQLSCQLSCNMSAQLHPVSSDETCHLSSTC